MTRVALIPSAYPPSVGGVEELTRHLALALVASGDQVEIWTGNPDDGGAASVDNLDGLVVRRFPMPLPATNLSAVTRTATVGLQTVRSLRRAVREFRPDVLHVQCFGPNGTYATVLSRMTGIPLMITLQGETLMDDADIFDISQVMRASLRAGIRTAAAVTACSAFTLDDAVRRFGLGPATGTVIPNAVDLGVVDVDGTPVSEDRPGKFLDGRPYVLALGRVVHKKGFDLLIAGYAAMDPECRSADLVIGGTGAALAELEAQAEASGVAERVHFVGRLHRDQVAAAMAGAEILVMPSRLEPFGIVALEGWRAGTAVVASSRGGAPEFIDDGVTGLLVDPFDVSAVARALERLLSDDALRRSIAAAGRRAVEDFGWPGVAERYRDLYRSVASSRHRRGLRSAPGPLGGPPQGSMR